MNLNIGFQLNETITEAVLDQLVAFDPTLAERSREDIPRTCTNIRILAAVGSITGLPLFLKIKDFVDRNLLEQNDPNLLNRGMFVPLYKDAEQIYIAVSNPWDPTAEDSFAQQYPELEVTKILAPAAEITQTRAPMRSTISTFPRNTTSPSPNSSPKWSPTASRTAPPTST
jgi:hypothetical protein